MKRKYIHIKTQWNYTHNRIMANIIMAFFSPYTNESFHPPSSYITPSIEL